MEFSFYSCFGRCFRINFFKLVRSIDPDIHVGIIQEFYEKWDCLLALIGKLRSD